MATADHEESIIEWWHVHAVTTVVWIVFAIVVPPLVWLGGIRTAGVLVFVLLPFVSAVLLSIPAYYWDAELLERRGSAWRPRWRWYALGSLVFTPLIVAPLYLWRRHRHVGVP